jgi:alcohol dehydrogenase YqhD (iron-dependent ADH family)
MTAINITAYTEDDTKIEAFKAFLKALKIKHSISKQQVEESPYNPAFVAKVKKSAQQYKDGKFTRVEKKDIKKFVGFTT